MPAHHHAVIFFVGLPRRFSHTEPLSKVMITGYFSVSFTSWGGRALSIAILTYGESMQFVGYDPKPQRSA